MTSMRDHAWPDRQQLIHDPWLTVVITERDRLIAACLASFVAGAFASAVFIL